jgi:hypothetical protein
MDKYATQRNAIRFARIAAMVAIAYISVRLSPAFAATLSRSMDVSGILSALWSMFALFRAAGTDLSGHLGR